MLPAYQLVQYRSIYWSFELETGGKIASPADDGAKNLKSLEFQPDNFPNPRAFDEFHLAASLREIIGAHDIAYRAAAPKFHLG